jgi:hypothetical protein
MHTCIGALKVSKNENYFGIDQEFCTYYFIVSYAYSGRTKYSVRPYRRLYLSKKQNY